MTVSKSDVFDMVKGYGAANSRPIPKRDVAAQYGDDGVAHLKALVEAGQLSCRRGRNGGYFLKGEDATPITDAPHEADNAPTSDVPVEDGSEDLAAQFAALEAKLAAAEAEEQNEQLPF